jgi:iron complex transport system substrate-binding protein
MRLKNIIWVMIFLLILGYTVSSRGETFKDSLGRKITLKGNPKRIVSLAPNITEILYVLGLGERLVGVTQFSSYPEEASLKPKVGSYINLNVEKIISLSPELVIGTVDGNEPGIVSLLEQAGIQVFIVNPRKVKQIIDTIASIGEVCGVKEKADIIVGQLNRRVNRVTRRIASRERPLVFLQINVRPIMTVNRNTYHHDLIRLAGGRNMAMERGGRFEKARQAWLRWKSIPAVRNNRVYLIDSDLIDRPSPRIIEGLEEMAKIIHPEVSWK